MNVPPPFKPLTYAPLIGANLRDIPTIEGIFRDLQARLQEVETQKDLITWLALHDEVKDALGEAAAETQVDYWSYTDNKEYQAANDKQEGEIATVLDKGWSQIQNALQKKPAFQALPPYYHPFRESQNQSVRLYREENRALQEKQSELSGEYERTKPNIELDGVKRTHSQIEEILATSLDRETRRKAWEAGKEAELVHADRFAEIFRALGRLRQQEAKNAGYILPGDEALPPEQQRGDYLRYGYATMERKYGPEDSLELHQALEDHLMPVIRAFQQDRLDAMIASGLVPPGTKKLRPYDLTVDPQGRPPLRPFESHAEFVPKMRRVFHAIDPRLGEGFDETARHGQLDAEDRDNKIRYYGYCQDFPLSREPFLCVNGGLTQTKVGTALHEVGHVLNARLCSQGDVEIPAAAFGELLPHVLELSGATLDPSTDTVHSRGQLLSQYRSEGSMDTCEAASMPLELIGAKHMDEMYTDPEDQNRASRQLLEEFCYYVAMVASTDAIEHWAHAHPGYKQEEMDQEWIKQANRFGGLVDYTGYEKILSKEWERRTLLFNGPLYSDYIRAGVGALQLMVNYEKDPKKTIDQYIDFLKAGSSLDTDKTYALAGIRFDPRGETLADTIPALESRFEALRRAEAHHAAAPRLDLQAIADHAPVPALSLAVERQASKV